MTYKGYTEARNKASQKYHKANLDQINIRVRKGKKKEYQDKAARKGKSLTGYIVDLIENDPEDVTPFELVEDPGAVEPIRKPEPMEPEQEPAPQEQEKKLEPGLSFLDWLESEYGITWEYFDNNFSGAEVDRIQSEYEDYCDSNEFC